MGVKLASYSEDWYGNEVDVVEMDGAVDKLEEIIYLESQVDYGLLEPPLRPPSPTPPSPHPNPHPNHHPHPRTCP